jgi:AcrR family transcriptional regulator
VALRTVFRHFADMDSLYRAISERMTAEIRPIVDQPLSGRSGRERLAELIEKRAVVFERLLAFKIASDAHRHASAFLQAEQRHLVKLQRQTLLAALSDAKLPPARREALDLVLSFEAWVRLRRDQRLGAREAKETLHKAADALLA